MLKCAHAMLRMRTLSEDARKRIIRVQTGPSLSFGRLHGPEGKAWGIIITPFQTLEGRLEVSCVFSLIIISSWFSLKEQKDRFLFRLKIQLAKRNFFQWNQLQLS